MSKYYCFVAGLPDVAFDGGKTSWSVERFREDICPMLSAGDACLVNLFFLARDNANMLRMLRGGNDVVLGAMGCYSREQLLEILASARDGDARCKDVPGYIYDFLECYYSNEGNDVVLWDDVLSAHYYSYAMSCSNKFISGWFEFNLNLNNIIVATLARKYKMNVADCVVGDNEVADALRSSGAKDFGLAGTVDYLETVLRLCDSDKLQEREHRLDELRWDWLDDNSVFNYFGVERLFVLLQKLDIMERWSALDADKGMQRYNEIIVDLKRGI